MPFLLPNSQEFKSQLSLDFLSKELPIELYRAWAEGYHLRNLKVGLKLDVLSRKPEIDLSKEPDVIYICKSTLILIANEPNVTTLVIRFGNDSAADGYSNLSVGLQGRDDNYKIWGKTYSGHIKRSEPCKQNPIQWNVDSEDYFKKRNELIINKKYSFQFHNEYGGIAHDLKLFTVWLGAVKGDEIALYFLYDGTKTTVAFVDADFSDQINTRIEDYSLFDQGNQCCPR